MKLIKLGKYQKNIDKSTIPSMSWIMLEPNRCLRTVSSDVEEIDSNDLKHIDRMVAYVDACYNREFKKLDIRPGIAIAANQVGLNKRIIYINFDENNTNYQYLLINPKITAYSNSCSYVNEGEGCLSVPTDVKGNIKRHYKIIVEAYDFIRGEYLEIVAKDLLSICLQHEIDHLNGKLYIDHINKEHPLHAENDWIKI